MIHLFMKILSFKSNCYLVRDPHLGSRSIATEVGYLYKEQGNRRGKSAVFPTYILKSKTAFINVSIPETLQEQTNLISPSLCFTCSVIIVSVTGTATHTVPKTETWKLCTLLFIFHLLKSILLNTFNQSMSFLFLSQTALFHASLLLLQLLPDFVVHCLCYRLLLFLHPFIA